MGIDTLVKNFKLMIAKRAKPQEDIDDDITTDRYLRSLRRQDRLQREELEKKFLIKKIAEFERKKTQQNLYGRLNSSNSYLKNGNKFLSKRKPLKGKFKLKM